MNNNINLNNINNINNSDNGVELEINLKDFKSIEEKCDYYKKEYLNYKSKFISSNNENNKLIKQRNKLLFQIGQLNKELKELKKNKDKNNIKKEYIILNHDNDNNINNNINNEENKIINNEDNFDIEKEIMNLNNNIYHENDILNESIYETLKEETDEQNKKLNELNNENNNDQKKKEFEDSFLLTLDSMNFEDDEEDNKDEEEDNIKIHSGTVLKLKKPVNKIPENKIAHPKRTYNNKYYRTKEMLSQKNIVINSIVRNNSPKNDLRAMSVVPYINPNLKFDEDIIKKSLTNEFIEYTKDNINLRKLIFNKEQKINNLYTFIKRWEHYSNILKKGIENFYKGIEIFNNNLLNKDNDNFIESPDLLGLIYLLQKNLNVVIEHCKSFLTTIDSLFILQIQNYRKKYFHKIRVQRFNLSSKICEILAIQNKFLSTKKSNTKNYKSAKENYYSKLKAIEINKYDYISGLNKILMMKQIELPQVISLLSFSLMSFFKQIHEILKEIDAPIKDNLEKINKKIISRNIILDNMKKEKKELEEKKIVIDKNKTIKEGFLNIKEINNDSNFKRRYVKIEDNNLIYYKIKKTVFTKEDGFDCKVYLNMIEKIDLNEQYNLCNLLLSNVKKNEKNYEYPFCFEITDASSKKNYILQAETQNEVEEWICTIQNAISDSISNFNVNSELKPEKKKNINVNSKEENEMKNNEVINNIINNNKCADCGVEKPTWLCLNWLTVVCIDCSAAHRSLGANISKVKGFRLDNISNDFIDLLEIIKQDDINKILEQNLIEDEKPKPDSKNNIKEQFIIDKYKNKKYFEITDLNINKEEIIKRIIKGIDENNLLEVYKYIKQNINDINDIFEINGEKFGLLHYCAGKGKIEMIKLLCALGADVNKEDVKGLKPIIYAKLNTNKENIEYLNKKEKI